MGASSVDVGRQHAHRAIVQVGKAACSKTCPVVGRVKLLLEEWPKHNESRLVAGRWYSYR